MVLAVERLGTALRLVISLSKMAELLAVVAPEMALTIGPRVSAEHALFEALDVGRTSRRAKRGVWNRVDADVRRGRAKRA